jgi:hypothetical protein
LPGDRDSANVGITEFCGPINLGQNHIDKILDLWAEEGKNRERVGEFIMRVGLGNFIEAIGLVKSIIQDLQTNLVSDEEIETAKNSIINSFVFRFEQKSQVQFRLHNLCHIFGIKNLGPMPAPKKRRNSDSARQKI